MDFLEPSFTGTRGKLLNDRRQTMIHSNQVLPPAVNTDKLAVVPAAPQQRSVQTRGNALLQY